MTQSTNKHDASGCDCMPWNPEHEPQPKCCVCGATATYYVRHMLSGADAGKYIAEDPARQTELDSIMGPKREAARRTFSMTGEASMLDICTHLTCATHAVNEDHVAVPLHVAYPRHFKAPEPS